MTGPVQVLVVGFDEPTFSGAVLAELGRLEQSGIVRLIDLLVVSRPDQSTLETVDIATIDPQVAPGWAETTGGIAAALLGDPDASAGDDAPEGEEGALSAMDGGARWSLADTVPVGQVAAVALIEHLWAIPLRTAMQSNGARPLDETWLGPADLERLDRLLAEPAARPPA